MRKSYGYKMQELRCRLVCGFPTGTLDLNDLFWISKTVGNDSRCLDLELQACYTLLSDFPVWCLSLLNIGPFFFHKQDLN